MLTNESFTHEWTIGQARANPELWRQQCEHKARHARLWGQPVKQLPPLPSPPVIPKRARLTEAEWIEAEKELLLLHQIAEAQKAVDKAKHDFVRVEQIQWLVCQHFGLSRAELLSTRRFKPTVEARQIAVYLAKLYTTKSLPDLGRRFGGKDHTTMMHAIHKVEVWLGLTAMGMMKRATRAEYEPKIEASVMMLSWEIERLMIRKAT